jgi:hypothetical protein
MQLACERGIVGVGSLRARYHYHIPPWLRLPQPTTNGLAQAPLDAIARDGVPDALVDREADARHEWRDVGAGFRRAWRQSARIRQRKPLALLPSALAPHALEILR